ncbi:MAG: hypothetical protein KKG34_04310, partial [Proteobacteria bacterium]|nr:hypothetical protein [Pseudomonadota bacterium]
MNAERPTVLEYPEYQEIRDDIWQNMPKWESFIIAIDGRDHSGKSSLGRYLSWQLGMSCLELDTFRNLQLSPYDFRLDDLRRSIDSRLERNRPVIVEGVTVRVVLR